MGSSKKYDKRQRFHLVYGIILGVSVITAGICLIAGCISIYETGDKPFSRESVANAFSGISVPVYVCLLLMVAGFVIDLIYPAAAGGATGRFKPHGSMLRLMRNKKDLSALSAEDQGALCSLRRTRKILRLVGAALIAAASVIFLIFALNLSNYDTADINGSMIGAMYILAPCLAVTYAYSVFVIYHDEKSMRREFDMLKKLPAKAPEAQSTSESDPRISAAKPKEKGFPDSNQRSASRLPLIRYALLALGIVLLLYGILTGGVAAVLTKAANICTECIGLG